MSEDDFVSESKSGTVTINDGELELVIGDLPPDFIAKPGRPGLCFDRIW